MSIMVLIEVPVILEEISNIQSYLAEILPDAQAYNGCQGIEVYFDTQDVTTMVLVEHWKSRAHHEKYVAWSTETGLWIA